MPALVRFILIVLVELDRNVVEQPMVHIVPVKDNRFFFGKYSAFLGRDHLGSNDQEFATLDEISFVGRGPDLERIEACRSIQGYLPGAAAGVLKALG